MIGFNFRLLWTPKTVTQAADKGAYKSFSHAAASIRKTGQAKIVKRPKGPAQPRKKRGQGTKKRSRRREIPSPPGSPPYTRRGQYKRAIVFAASKEGAVIGPRFSVLGRAGEAHEHGKRFKGQSFPQRPTMGPSLSENLSRVSGAWAGSIGS